MCGRFPSCDQVRMCNSGTEANINAIGLARAVTGREGVLVQDAYHGGVLTFDGVARAAQRAFSGFRRL